MSSLSLLCSSSWSNLHLFAGFLLHNQQFALSSVVSLCLCYQSKRVHSLDYQKKKKSSLWALCLYSGLRLGVTYICFLGFFFTINNLLFHQWSICVCVCIINQKELFSWLSKEKKSCVFLYCRFEDCESMKHKHHQKLSDLLLIFVLLGVLLFLFHFF